ncbi:hypothetical protein G3545_09955 [Starkeya sp. ORNL1]|uniref:hypothetical protein n=1 Tax=Starkeya sp. ORNL1 TaxID=2709380 RepID=UPI001463EDB9|nr:hypothetical protein [Starkeya sp. ORNL1]QJP13944.1 hypothetical protein G3545_09955 [Starkeya sp. ORNL1]
MASYTDDEFLTPSSSPRFDKIYRAGAITRYSGIYRCPVCSTEVASIKGHPLPGKDDHRHNNAIFGAPRWQLIVGTVEAEEKTTLLSVLRRRLGL